MIPQHTNNEFDFRLPAPQVQNVVGMVYLKTQQPLKLTEVASKCNNAQYNPKRFNGMIWRNKRPKATFLVFPNGKTIVAGSRSEVQFNIATRKLIKKFNQLGIIKQIQRGPRICITNIVSTANTKMQINLQKMNRDCPQAQHQPSTFPGLVFKMKSPKITFLVFSSGKIVITGAKSEKQSIDGFKKFYKTIKKYQKKLPVQHH